MRIFVLLFLLSFPAVDVLAAVKKCQCCERDKRGRIKRSQSERRKFMMLTGYPFGRSNYVVDHVIPLCKCGPDLASNMAWMTKADAANKDRSECK